VLAQRLHALSGRKPLVSLNCAAVAENLLDDELFGHVRGAFSGAEKDREGLLRAADGGTLFLDEVGDMPPAMQVKLLRFLEEQRVRPVGSDREIAVEVRLIAATHRDLRERVEAGRFRDDLLARLGVLPLRVPALRERREDLGLLLRALLPAKVRFTPEAMALVCGYSWPRNVRELRAAVLSAADLAAAAGEASIAPHHLPEPVRHPPKAAEPKPLPELTEADRELRDRVGGLLRQHGGNISAVARELGKGRTQIHRWMARFGLGS
jgi:transcriptional regulator with GAF, ATPase, and Fis domain